MWEGGQISDLCRNDLGCFHRSIPRLGVCAKETWLPPRRIEGQGRSARAASTRPLISYPGSVEEGWGLRSRVASDPLIEIPDDPSFVGDGLDAPDQAGRRPFCVSPPAPPQADDVH